MSIIVLIKKIIFKSEEKNKLRALVVYHNTEYTLYTNFTTWIEEGSSVLTYGTINETIKHIYTTACIPYLEKNLLSFKTFIIAAKIPGLSESKIQLLINKFGEKIISIFFEEKFERLQEIPFFSEERIIIIAKNWKLIQTYSMLHLALYQSGLSASSVKKLYKTYKEESLKKLKENPYQIIETVGYGFLTADKIAQEYGITMNAAIRIEAAILYLLKKNESEGKAYLSILSIEKATQILLKTSLTSENLLFHIKALEQRDEIILLKKTYVATKKIYLYENSVYLFLKNNKLKKSPQLLLPFYKQKLVEEQKKAIMGACSHLYTIITGPAGTGKSTCIVELFTLLTNQGKKVLILTPTGRASQRIKELLSDATVMTIHKALGIKYIQEMYKNSSYHETIYLPYDHIIIDESSMIDAFIFYCIVKKINQNTAITLIGDKNQLPPIGPGAIFEALIETNSIPIFALKEIHRQAKNNTIIEIASQIAEGVYPKIPENPIYNCYFETVKKENLQEKLTELTKAQTSPETGILPFQILTFLHKGIAGINTINLSIQKTLFELRKKKDNKKIFEKFFVGDKVIVTKNNYELGIFNGEIGYIKEGKEKKAIVEFTDKIIAFEEEHAFLLDLAYAISIHKSQGSEFNSVILLLYPEQYILLNKKSLYTGLTRGKKKVHIIGEKKTLYISLKKEYETKQNSLIPIIKKLQQ